MQTPPANEWMLTDLGLMAYRHAHELQLGLLESRIDGRLDRDTILFVEHPPVFTLGRRGDRGNLMVSDSFLKEKGIEVIKVERGGDITYHGPGQLVVYMLIDLKARGGDIRWFVRNLESVMLQTSGDFGVEAVRDSRNAGIWVNDKKLGSIGIAVRRGITFHGIALNVNTLLTPFQWVNPCGLSGVSMSSLNKETNTTLPMDDVKTSLARHLQTAFNVTLSHISQNTLSHYTTCPHL